jgi:hypothetical protein
VVATWLRVDVALCSGTALVLGFWCDRIKLRY